MKNVEHFGDLTPRMNQFREKVLNELPYIDATRAVLCTEAYQQNLHQSAVMKRALMLKNILEKMPIQDYFHFASNDLSISSEYLYL